MNENTQAQSRPRGRPSSPVPLVPRQFKLSQQHYDTIVQAGNGVAVRGLRRMVEAWDRAQFDAVQVPQEPPQMPQNGGGEGAT